LLRHEIEEVVERAVKGEEREIRLGKRFKEEIKTHNTPGSSDSIVALANLR
jgi:hypothetical protein